MLSVENFTNNQHVIPRSLQLHANLLTTKNMEIIDIPMINCTQYIICYFLKNLIRQNFNPLLIHLMSKLYKYSTNYKLQTFIIKAANFTEI